MADDDRNRACWVCFATDEDDREAGWVQPCRCKGTTKWVHQQCLQRWIDEKQRGNQSQRVSCPQCNTEYLIFFPKYSTFVYVLDLVDRLLYRASPFLAAGVVLGSVYWTAVTYGAVTVMQVIGHREGLNVMEQADPLFLLVGLPTIPIMLVLGKMVRWDHYLLKLWWRHAGRLAGVKGIFSSLRGELPANTFVAPSEATLQLLERPLFGDALSATRVLVSALFLPTAATFVGRFCFTSVENQLHRTLLIISDRQHVFTYSTSPSMYSQTRSK
ncbi:E3 ubiquitin-protein ligase MARCH5-like isoform X2 [Varroa jacobsoni]|uniref:E3 ubiquitin-protein ligase MARCH5-like isoform X2 n=1 Tax=Varroa jacobsoni TaxID=62625 RepID=UPI000BF96A07|nr:E3 ubiquitin-protein ligase MARCH5-like isoform X2 [Varroa jacobsoni]